MQEQEHRLPRRLTRRQLLEIPVFFAAGGISAAASAWGMEKHNQIIAGPLFAKEARLAQGQKELLADNPNPVVPIRQQAAKLEEKRRRANRDILKQHGGEMLVSSLAFAGGLSAFFVSTGKFIDSVIETVSPENTGS